MKSNNNKKKLTLVQEWFEIGNQELGYAKAAFNDFDNFYGHQTIF